MKGLFLEIKFLAGHTIFNFGFWISFTIFAVCVIMILFIWDRIEQRVFKKKYEKRRRIEKKVWQEYFEDILNGKKGFELRLADFDCKEGDILVLREWDRYMHHYTGRSVEKVITYVLHFSPDDPRFWTTDEVRRHGLQVISLDDLV